MIEYMKFDDGKYLPFVCNVSDCFLFKCRSKANLPRMSEKETCCLWRSECCNKANQKHVIGCICWRRRRRRKVKKGRDRRVVDVLQRWAYKGQGKLMYWKVCNHERSDIIHSFMNSNTFFTHHRGLVIIHAFTLLIMYMYIDIYHPWMVSLICLLGFLS